MKSKKGFGLTVDAIISLAFIMIIMTALIGFRFTGTTESTTTSFKNLHFISEDILDVLNKQGILDQIGEEWTADNETGAASIAQQYLDDMVPPNVGYRLIFDDRTIVENQRVLEQDTIAKTHSTRLLAGYAKNKTTLGSASRAFLTGILEKTSSVYAYFGGSVGKGNITKNLIVPNGSTITEAYMEMNAGHEFDLFINGQPCNNSHSPAGGYMSANIKEDITSCNFNTGTNIIEIIFTGGSPDEQSIGGGFVRATYNASDLNVTDDGGGYFFPGIDGFIDLYSSVYAPGIINNLSIHLEFFNNYSTYLKIGDVMIYNSTGDAAIQIVDLDDSYLSNKLNYYAVSEKTVPVRLRTGENSSIYESGNVDVILITDLSESMKYRVGYTGGNGVVRNCSDPQILNNDTRRVSLAKCLDMQFVDVILNITGNRVGLVGFNEDVYLDHSLSTDINSLKGHINNYPDDPSGDSCICCAINNAYNMLNSQSQPEKEKFIIVMADGIASHCCGTTGWWWWAECDDTGISTTGRFSDCDGMSADCNGTQCDGAIDNAIWSTQRVNSDFNATIHSIGFGPIEECYNANYTLQQIASSGGGNYCFSDDTTELQNCYGSIVNSIANTTKTQTVNITGNITRSILYPSSYIDGSITPSVAPPEYGEIELSYDTDRFNDNVTCEGTFFVPSGVTVVEARVTSYSSEHWTDYVHVKNSFGTRVNYRLSDYGTDYIDLGDPFIVDIVPDYIYTGENNTIKILTGDDEDTSTGCSVDDRAILTIKLSSSTGYGDVFPDSDGCDWTFEFDDYSTVSGGIPTSYNGSNTCKYTSTNQSYVTGDAVADAVYRLMRSLDIDDDGRVDIKIDTTQVEVDFSRIGGVRSLWGPAQLKLVVWI